MPTPPPEQSIGPIDMMANDQVEHVATGMGIFSPHQ